MKTEKNEVEFFMGANTPDGFYSLYGELQRPIEGVRRYLIKGGAGTGKSSIMKRAAGELADYDALIEKIHCSSDPNSLDGVIFHTGGASIVDATPPHVIEPAYPGSFETVINLCEYFDEEKLEKRLPEIVTLQTANNTCHKKCRGLLKCADILLKDSYAYVETCTDFDKIASLAARISKKEFPSKGGNGREYRRLLSAVTNQGVVTYSGTAKALCHKIWLLRDEYGVSSNALLQSLRTAALQKGHTVFTCRCPLSPEEKLEHIFLPELGIGFVTQTRFNNFSSVVPDKVIDYSRFTDMAKLRRKKQLLSFNRKAAAELIGAAVSELKKAKIIHDELEKKYTDAVDFKKVTRKTDELLKKLAERYR